MRRVLHGVWVVVVGSAVLLVVVALGLLAFAHTDRFRELAREKLEGVLDEAIPARVTIGSLDGSLLHSLRADDVEILFEGDAVVRLDTLQVEYALWPVVTGRPLGVRLALVRPRVRAEQSENGEWDLVRAFASDSPPEPASVPASDGGLPFPVEIEPIRVRDGALSATLPDGATYSLDDLRLDAEVSLDASEFDAWIRRLSATIQGPDLPTAKLFVQGGIDGKDSRAEIADVRIETDDSILEIAGKVEGFDAPVIDARLDARVRGPDLESLGLESTSEDEVIASATLAGPWSDLRARVHVDGPAGELDVDATADLADAAPRYEIEMAARDFDPAAVPGTPAEWSGDVSLEAHASGRGASLNTMKAQISLDVAPSRIGPIDDLRGRLQANIADGAVSVEDTRISADTAKIALAGQITLDEGESTPVGDMRFDLSITQLSPWLKLAGREGAGRLAVEGTLEGTPGALTTEGRVRIDEVRIGEQRLDSARLEYDVSGVGSDAAHGKVSLEASNLNAGVELDRVTVNASLEGDTVDVRIVAVHPTTGTQEAEARVRIADQRTSIDLRELALRAPGAGTWKLAAPTTLIVAEGRTQIDPLTLRGDHGRLTVDGTAGETLDLGVDVDSLDLRLLETFSGDSVQDVRGSLNASLRIRGATATPKVEGTVRVDGGGAEVPALGLEIEQATARLEARGDQIVVREISARSRDGRVGLSGEIELADARPSAVDLALTADRFPVIHTDRYRAWVDTSIEVRGTLEALSVSGEVDVVEASLRPDLSILGGPSIERDETIEVVYDGERPPWEEPASEDPDGEEEEPPAFFDTMSVDVTTRLGRNTFVRHEQALVELAGSVRATKEPHRDLSVVGTIRTLRGWIAFQGRRFQLRDSRVRFSGGREIDPTLQVTAARSFPDHEVFVEVGGSASEPSLELRSSPGLPKADILSLILFGKTIDDLSGGEKARLEDQAADLVAGYAASELGRSVSDALGLDHLGIDIRQVDFEGGSVGAGRYIAEDTYLAIEQSVTGDAGTEVRVEHHLTPTLRLHSATGSEGDSEAGFLWRKRY